MRSARRFTRVGEVSDTIRSVIQQLEAKGQRTSLSVDQHELPVTNLDKPLWPGGGRRKSLTKRDLLRYFALVSPWMLPHLTARPIFVTRFPNGITGKSFYQKHWEPVPPFARTVTIYSSHGDEDGEYLLCENLPTLLWLGQMGGLELHAWFSRIEREPDARTKGRRFHGSEAALERSVLNYPDFVVFDLDPYEYSGREARGEEPQLHRRAFNRTRRLALRVRELLERLGLSTWIKTSGRTGLHLYLPIVRDLDFDGAREVAETIARAALQERPREVTLEWSVERRQGKIFFDYNQNSRGKSLAVPYSPRRHPNGTVATPVTWEELETIYPTDFTLRTVPGRLETEGDPWAGILEQKQDLGAALAAGSGR
ncbi:MAG: non-homologous end-joining DNA ligase [Gemmatimonadales bacterium]